MLLLKCSGCPLACRYLRLLPLLPWGLLLFISIPARAVRRRGRRAGRAAAAAPAATGWSGATAPLLRACFEAQEGEPGWLLGGRKSQPRHKVLRSLQTVSARTGRPVEAHYATPLWADRCGRPEDWVNSIKRQRGPSQHVEPLLGCKRAHGILRSM